MNNNRLHLWIFLMLALATFLPSYSQTDPQNENELKADSLNLVSEWEEGSTLAIPPLFEYVVAPDNLPDLRSRTDYLMDKFWSPFDFKGTKSVDQNALTHAFNVYVQAMPFASEKKVLDSVKKLISNIKNNPGLTLQFTKAAEEALYGKRAEFWSDQLYIPFLENLMANKKVPDSKKKKYKEQLELLKRNALGAPLPQINFVSLDDSPSTLIFNKPFTILEFKTLDCEDCRYSDLKLDISSVVSDFLYENKLDVYTILIPENDEAITLEKSALNPKWHTGYSQNASTLLDLRMVPSFYLVDGSGKILAKNEVVDSVIEVLKSLSETNKSKK